jgi:hypothetical protein
MRVKQRIDFVPQRRWPAAGMALALVCAGAAAWQGSQALADADRLQQQRDGIAGLVRRATPTRPAMSPADVLRHSQIAVVARQLANPWQDLLSLFEEHSANHIVLVKFQPDAATGRVELTGRAPNAQALGDYLIALERDPRLTAVLLHQHELLRDVAGSPLQFMIGATWGAAAAPAPEPASSAGTTP